MRDGASVTGVNTDVGLVLWPTCSMIRKCRELSVALSHHTFFQAWRIGHFAPLPKIQQCDIIGR